MNKVEIIVKTLFARIVFEESLVGILVVPWLIGGTGFLCWKDVNKARMGAALFQNFSNTFFLAKVLLWEILDTQVILAGNLFDLRNQFIPQSLCKLRVVSDTDYFLISFGLGNKYMQMSLQEREPESIVQLRPQWYL